MCECGGECPPVEEVTVKAVAICHCLSGGDPKTCEVHSKGGVF